MQVRQPFDDLVTPPSEVGVAEAPNDRWAAVTEQHATRLPHGFDMRVAVVEHAGAGDRVRGWRVRLTPVQQADDDGPLVPGNRETEHLAAAVPATAPSRDRP